ncbi:MAG TPA: hypothetical protein VGM14_13960 [Streptosporangiaceae bacterium]
MAELKTLSRAFSLKSLLGLISGDAVRLGSADTVLGAGAAIDE